MEIGILFGIFLFLRQLWMNWLKPIIKGRKMKLLKGYMYKGKCMVPFSDMNPDGSYYFLVGKSTPYTRFINFFGLKAKKALNVDYWHWQPYVYKGYIHDMGKEIVVPSLHHKKLFSWALYHKNQKHIKERI